MCWSPVREDVSFCFVSRWRSSVRDLMAFPLWGVEFISLVFKICRCYLNDPPVLLIDCTLGSSATLWERTHTRICACSVKSEPKQCHSSGLFCLPRSVKWDPGTLFAGWSCLAPYQGWWPLLGSGFSWKPGFRWHVWIGLFAWHL